MSRTKPHFPKVYYTLCVLLYLIALPLLFITSFRQKHKESIPQRFFPWRIAPLAQSPKYWFHACSFGEVRSLSPLIHALQSRQSPSSGECETILVTTITQTGYNEAKKLFGDANFQNLDSQKEATTSTPSADSEKSTSPKAQAAPQVIVRYLPFELFLPLWGSSLTQLQSLIVTEAEIWKMLFYLGKTCGAKTLLINARISTRSLPSYQRFAWFYRGVFATIDSILAQSSVDKERLEALGGKNVKSFGNLKALSLPRVSTHYPKPAPLIFTAASTHKGEEKLILDAYLAYINALSASLNPTSESSPDSEKLEAHAAATSESSLDSETLFLSPRPMLLLVPRHPERFEEVFTLTQSYAKAHNLRLERFSNLYKHNPKAPLSTNMPFDILIIDTLGELINLYALSDIVILGGSFVPVGGHNPLEVAHFGIKLISGEHIFNQHALFELVKNYTLIPPHALAHTLLQHKTLLPTALEVPTSELLEQIISEIVSESRLDSEMSSQSHTTHP